MSDIFKLSVSKTATFETCKAKYKFSYILRLPKKEFEYHTLGRFVHKVLEEFHLTIINGFSGNYSKLMSEVYKSALTEYRHKLSEASKKEAFEIVDKYLKRFIINGGSEAQKVISVEKSFNIEIRPHLILNGMIDRVQIDNDGIYHVVDYKTTKSLSYIKDDKLQLLTYAYVLLCENPQIDRVRTSYIMLRHNSDFITDEFSKEKILQIKEIYEDYADKISAEQKWDPNPTKLCRYCDFISSCPTGKNFVSKDFDSGKMEW